MPVDRLSRITRELLFATFAGPSAEADDPDVLERLTTSVEAETMRPGDVLFRAGDESTHVHFMSEGRMRLGVAGRPDWIYDGRWVVGTTDVLVGRPRARTAIMETEARMFRLPAARWFEVMDHRPEVLLNALVGFARGVAAFYCRLEPDGGFPPAVGGPSLDVASLAARARLIAAAPLFHGIPMQSLLELAHLAEARDLEAGEVLFSSGVAPGRAFIVTAGRVEARRDDPHVSAAFATGSVVGGALCLGDAEAAWSARALERSAVLSFSTQDLFDHVEEHQDGVRAMMGAFALERERACEVLADRTGELLLT